MRFCIPALSGQFYSNISGPMNKILGSHVCFQRQSKSLLKSPSLMGNAMKVASAHWLLRFTSKKNQKTLSILHYLCLLNQPLISQSNTLLPPCVAPLHFRIMINDANDCTVYKGGSGSGFSLVAGCCAIFFLLAHSHVCVIYISTLISILSYICTNYFQE